MKKLLAVYNNWDDAGYRAMQPKGRSTGFFDEKEELAGYKRLHGTCKGYKPIEIKSAFEAQFALECERGPFEMRVLLSPRDGLIEGFVGITRDAPIVEPSEDALTICSLWRRREANEKPRTKMLKELVVRFRGGVVKLVDDDHVERVRGELRDASCVKGLDIRKDVLASARTLAAAKAFTEDGIAKNDAEDRQALFKDLVPVRNEQETWSTAEFPGKALVIERCDEGLARAGRRHNEVPEMTSLTLGLQALEHLFLMRLWFDMNR
jgi:hypothetical protein